MQKETAKGLARLMADYNDTKTGHIKESDGVFCALILVSCRINLRIIFPQYKKINGMFLNKKIRHNSDPY